jgi:protein-tyrosine-phosphatase
MMVKLKDKILVVCSGNINRSPVAEYLFRKLGFTNVDSCGLGKSAAKGLPMAKKMRMTFDIDYSHKSKSITKELVDWSDIVFCMGPGQVRKVNKLYSTDKAIMLGGVKIDDPHFTNNHQEVKDQIENIIKEYKNPT